MQLQPKSPARKRSDSMDERAAPKPSGDQIADLLPNLARLVQDGQITLGNHPVGCLATASDRLASRVMLVRRKHESLTELLTRLDCAIGLAFEEAGFAEEIARP